VLSGTAAVVGTEVDGAVVGAAVVEPVLAPVLAVLVAGGALVAEVANVVAAAGAVVVGAMPWDALLPPPPQPAARTPADSNAAGQ
jgi:hypothetical protein